MSKLLLFWIVASLSLHSPLVWSLQHQSRWNRSRQLGPVPGRK